MLHEGELGGATVSLLRMAPQLAERWELRAWVPQEGPVLSVLERLGIPACLQHRPHAFSLAGMLEPPGVWRRSLGVPAYLAEWSAWLRRESPDLLLFNTVLTTPELLASVVAGGQRPRTVLHVHELLDRSPKALLAAQLARLAELRLVPSLAARARLRRLGVDADVLYPGVPEPPLSRRRSSARSRRPVVGYVGTVCPVKGADLFIAIVERLRAQLGDDAFSARLVGRAAAGRWREWGEQTLALASRRGIDCRVPPPDADDRWSLRELAEIDVLVVPSRADACPLVVLEAMASGVATVAFAVGGVPEQLDGGAGVLVPAGNVAALAQAAALLVRDPRERRRLALAGRERQRRLFGLERQARGLDLILHRVLGRTPRSAAVTTIQAAATASPVVNSIAPSGRVSSRYE